MDEVLEAALSDDRKLAGLFLLSKLIAICPPLLSKNIKTAMLV